MPKKLGTHSNDSEGLVAEFTIEKGSTPNLKFEGRINHETLNECESKKGNRRKRCQCESFLEVLHAFYEALNGEHEPHEKTKTCGESDCSLVLEFHVNGQVARLESPLKAWYDKD